MFKVVTGLKALWNFITKKIMIREILHSLLMLIKLFCKTEVSQ